MKKEQGITLLSLVITIIILILLAGISIHLVLGENGIIEKAQTAVGKYKNAQEEENISIKNYENEMISYGGRSGNADVLDKEIEFVGMYMSSTYVPRTSGSSVTIQNVEPGKYVIVGFKTFCEGGHHEFHLHTGDEITSITNATFSSVGNNKTVYRMEVSAKSDVTINFPPSHPNNNGDGGYSYVWLFK